MNHGTLEKEIAKYIHENNISFEEYYAYFIEK